MKTILITGANGNLGTEVVKNLNDKGFNILATVGRSKPNPEFQKLTKETRSVNLTNENETQEFVNDMTRLHPNLSAAVLLVGGFAAGGFKVTDSSLIDKQISLNFKTAYFIVRPLLEYFEENGGGQFILIGARPAINANIGKDMLAYALSKAMVMQLAAFINEAGVGKNISATVLLPSSIDTPANRSAMPKANFSKWVKTTHIAETIAFILSEAGENLRNTEIKIYNES